MKNLTPIQTEYTIRYNNMKQFEFFYNVLFEYLKSYPSQWVIWVNWTKSLHTIEGGHFLLLI